MPRWSKLLLAGLIIGVLVAGAGLAVVWARLPQIAENLASSALGRSVRIGGLSISPGRWIGVEMSNASYANLPGGTRPEMFTLAHLTGEVQLWPLLHGTIVARDVRVEQADLLLEKVNGQPNWRNGPRTPKPQDGGRAGFPTLLGLAVDGVVTFRTTSGAPLVTRLNGVRLEAASPSAPAHLTGPGSYQGVPVQLDLRLGSFDQLHDAAIPFPTDVTMTSGNTVLHFDGTMTDPLNVDGADGQLSLAAPQPGPLEAMAGLPASPAPELRLAGAFHRQGDLWRLKDASGTLGEARLVGGTLTLQEGDQQDKTPDQVTLDLRFDQVDLDRLLAALESPGRHSDGSGFVPAAKPDPEVSATIEAAGLQYRKFRLLHPKLSAAMAPGLLKLDAASFGALGGQVQLDGKVEADDPETGPKTGPKTGTLTASVSATGLDVAGAGQTLGIGSIPLTGKLDLHATAEGRGATAAAALQHGRAHAVATMAGGSVSEQLIELASTDVAGLFRSSRAMTGLNCLLAVVDVRNGTAALDPVRLRSSDGTIVASGKVNLLRETVDLVVASEARTTGTLALDVPIRLTGRLDDPSVAPAASDAGRAALAARSIADLPPSLRANAQRSACAAR